MAEAKQLLIVAHAPSPNTIALRAAVERGARHPDVEAVDVRVLPPLEAGPEDVLACDAIILGTTENLGYMSGALKVFLCTGNLVSESQCHHFIMVRKNVGLPSVTICGPYVMFDFTFQSGCPVAAHHG
ncbi:hypothetical protein [Marinobacter sp.]|uniref:hypothetical protein n=1 Tax=Marinobacter sp. TaxID=50741 RepID=UPI00384BDA91